MKVEILLWDDKNTERELIEEMLVKIGCNIISVNDELECLTQFSNRRFSLVIFDQAIPHLDVKGFLDKLAEIDPFTPIAMMATLNIEYYEKKYGDTNIDFLIFKPFEYVQLQKLIDEAMELSGKLRGRSFAGTK
jgi:DNA-binding NtrC family response regulator